MLEISFACMTQDSVSGACMGSCEKRVAPLTTDKNEQDRSSAIVREGSRRYPPTIIERLKPSGVRNPNVSLNLDRAAARETRGGKFRMNGTEEKP